MIHVIIERPKLEQAVALARQLFSVTAPSGRHVLLDAPGDFRTNLPERRMSAAEILISARIALQPTTTTS